MPGQTQDEVLDQCARLIANGAGNPKGGPGPLLESVFMEGSFSNGTFSTHVYLMLPVGSLKRNL